MAGTETNVSGTIVKGQYAEKYTNTEQIDISISGGTFSSDVSAYVPENYKCEYSASSDTYAVSAMENELLVTPENND